MKKIILLLVICYSINFAAKDTVIFKADYIPYPDTVMVVTPGEYNTGEENAKFPLLYLFHGWTGYWSYWNEISDLQSLADEYGFIIVCPDGFNDSWYINNPMKENVQFEKFFRDDLVPKIETTYSIQEENIFITGLSMGGHGAITLFLKNREHFNSAGSMSGILDLTFFPDRWSIKEGIGSILVYPEVWENNSAYYLLDDVEPNCNMIIECGTEDFAYEVNERFVEKARLKGFNIYFISRKGKHNREFWKKGIENHLNYFKNLLR